MSRAEEILAALDPEQREVATCLDGPVCVIAGAGTGKTRAITHRLAYAAQCGRYDPTATLAVTFTTRAAGEMRTRLQELGVRGVQARTFHSAALRQAQYFWPQAYGCALPTVSEQKFGMIAESARRLRLSPDTATLRDLAAEISWSKVSNVSSDNYAAVAAQQAREIAACDATTVSRVFAEYEEIKRDRGVIDFDDILLCCVALLTEHRDVAETVRRTYRHFVVDEYQDVSPLQEALLKLWRADRRDICVVGDPAQTIHSFAGAQSRFLLNFASKNPGSTTIKLVRNYRSTPHVVSLANKVAGPEAVVLHANRDSGTDVSFVATDNEADEAASIAAWLAEMAEDGVNYRDMAVLFRLNAQSPALEAALTQQNIPYLVRGSERFYERAEVRQALVMLRAAVKSDDGRAGVTQLRHLLAGMGWSENAPNSQGAARERWESLDALVTLAEDVNAEMVAGSGRCANLTEIAQELDLRAQAQHVPTAQGVTLATIHAAKGLEWDAVALFGIHEGTLPLVLATTPAQLAEERRLLYVGVTRARTSLRVSWSRGRSGSGGSRGPSRYLRDALPAEASRAKQAQRRKTTIARCRVCGGQLSEAADRKLGRHMTCESSYDEDRLDRLKAWRKAQASELKIPAYCVFTDATLIAIAETMPTTSAQLIAVPGVGKAKVTKFGAAVIDLIQS